MRMVDLALWQFYKEKKKEIAMTEKYLRGLPTSQDVATLSFEFIEQVLNDADTLPQSARHDPEWRGNQKQ